MENASPLNSLRTTLLEPTWLAIFASVGIHALLAVGWPMLPMSSKTVKPASTINVIQLTPQEQRLLPDLSTRSQITLPPIPSPINSLPPLPALPGEGQLPKLPPLDNQITAYNFPPLPPPNAFPKLTDLPPPISLPDLYSAIPPTSLPDWSNLTSPADIPDWSNLPPNNTVQGSLKQPPAMAYPNWDRLPAPPPLTSFNPPPTSGGTLPNPGLQAGLSPLDQMLPADQPDNPQAREVQQKVAQTLEKRQQIARRQQQQEQAARKTDATGATALAKPGTPNSSSLTPEQQRRAQEERIAAMMRQRQQQQQAAATATGSISENDQLRLRATEAYTVYFAQVQKANPDAVMASPQSIPAPYPKEAGSPQKEAAALVAVTVNPQGKVVEAQLLTKTGNEVLDKAAINAVMQAQYDPTEKPVVYQLVVQFQTGNSPQNAAPATEKPAQNQQPTPEKPATEKPAQNQQPTPEKPATEKPAPELIPEQPVPAPTQPEQSAPTPEKPAAEQLEKQAPTPGAGASDLIPEQPAPAPESGAPAQNPDKSTSVPKKPTVNQTSKESSAVPQQPAATPTQAATPAPQQPAATPTQAATPAPQQPAPELIPEKSPLRKESALPSVP
ncbi:TonB family protein [Microcoleus sp. FACHB-672]|uniref:TonB family protein n=1 Tax=Microcoleus sp. FACHB-672 TaxID=2692825 RepID=UPI001A7E3C7C|nr:TonB family protein [Microcoleus sp. FACHB-672]